MLNVDLRTLSVLLVAAVAVTFVGPASSEASAAEPTWRELRTSGLSALENKQFDEAERYLLAAYEQAYAAGPKDSRFVPSVVSLARLYREEKEWAAAMSLLTKALGIQEKASGVGHASTVKTLNEIAMIHYAQGDLLAAEGSWERALSIKRKQNGGELPGWLVNNLGEVYRRLGHTDRAEKLLVEALATKERNKGDDDPALITTLNDLGVLYTDLKRFDDAKKALERAHVLAVRHLGPESDVLGTVLHNQGHMAYRQSQFEVAVTSYLAAVSVREKQPRRGQPDLARSLGGLANALMMARRYEASEEAIKRAIAVATEFHGAKNRSVAKLWSDYAMLLRTLKRTDEADAAAARAQAATP